MEHVHDVCHVHDGFVMNLFLSIIVHEFTTLKTIRGLGMNIVKINRLINIVSVVS